MSELRVGIFGTGRIADRFVRTMGMVDGIVLSCVYNKRIQGSIDFVSNLGLVDNICTDDLGKAIDMIDVAYIATPHQTHYEYAKFFLENGIHVLCEKPMVLSKTEAIELYEIAKENRVILMEALKTAYCPGFYEVLKLARDGRIGRVVDVESCFTRLNNSSTREVWDVDNGGSFTEFSTYTLLPVVKLLGTDIQDSKTFSLPAVTGVDSYTKTMYMYEHGCATVKCGLGAKSEGQLLITGTNGYILVPSPWWLTSYAEVHYEDSKKVERYSFEWSGSGLQYELETFVNRVLAFENVCYKYNSEIDGAQKINAAWEFLENDGGLTPKESVWMAERIEEFLDSRKKMKEKSRNESGRALLTENESLDKCLKNSIKVWAHRGCSMLYPENTLPAFLQAARLKGIAGIELDIQLSKDGEIVVIHDERIDRTTNGVGAVRDYTLSELKEFLITGSGNDIVYECEEKLYDDCGLKAVSGLKKSVTLTIPTMRQVLELLKPYCVENGLMINIELKNSVIRYEGMEEKILKLVKEYDMEEYIVYSSFNHESMGVIKELNPEAKTGTLATNILDCMYGLINNNADCLHPSVSGLDINKMSYDNNVYDKYTVRAWGGDEPFFGQDRLLKERDMFRFAKFGVTDIITNVPENYLK